jgi:hypothetical protein
LTFDRASLGVADSGWDTVGGYLLNGSAILPIN